jgi:hypothetical protein
MPQVKQCKPSRLMLSRLISQARSGSVAADEAAVARQIWSVKPSWCCMGQLRV